jgi:threonylcarbamoyladenosine tRNA methylthiotransferase MtaB
LNQAETALIADTFRARGYTIVPFGSPAEVTIINTCSVTARADAHCRNAIRRARKSSPQAIVAAVRCYAQSDTEAVRSVLGVDYVIGTDRKLTVAELIESGGKPPSPEIVVARRHTDDIVDFAAVGYYPDATRANIKIQDGCDFCCSFCILPRVRGRARSRRMADIVAEARELVRRGHREIVLAGVSIGSYVGDGFRLADVARNIETIEGVKRVRLSSIEPTTIEDDLLEWMATSPKACRHLHIPAQSGDDAVLKAMRRACTVEDFTRLIDRIMTRMPDLGLGTDIIAGFPGEGEQEFQNTVRFVEQIPFSYVHVFSYSDRPKTAAARLPVKNSRETVKQRSDTLHELARAKKRAFAERCLGRRVEILAECRDDNGFWSGLTSQYVRVRVPADGISRNQLLFVVPETYRDGVLMGRPDIFSNPS